VRVEPIPEVEAAAEELAALSDGWDLLDGLRTMAQLASVLVPSCVGISLTVIVDGEAYTVTATDSASSALDAAQYLGGGPCVDAALDRREINMTDVLDESRWQFFEQAAASSGVRSSLSLPVGDSDGEPPAALNLYASEPDAFKGREELLARAFGASSDWIVRNAHLSFRTRNAARELPRRLEEKERIEMAVGVLMGARGLSREEARERLLTAAQRASAPVDDVVKIILAVETD
jgi:GAF domain-containing protein